MAPALAGAAGVDVDIDALEDAARRDTPPCEARTLWLWEFRKLAAFRRDGNAGHLCGRPSAFRMTVACRACGACYRLFLCRVDAWSFRRGKRVLCRACGAAGRCRAEGS